MFGKWTITVLSALLAVSPLLADERNGQAVSQQEAPASAAKPAPQAAEKPAAPDIAAQIEQLRLMVLEQARQMEAQQKLMQSQQEKLNALTEELRAARAAASAASAPAPQAATLDARVAKVEADVAANKKSSEEGIKSLGSLKLSGDIRARYEPFFGGGAASAAAPPSRHRERYRLRINGNTKLGEDFNAGFAFASGDTGDPISTNSTETGFFTRKPISVDRAFITYHPHAFKALSITGGKFAYTWQKTELTWDVDLNPEGASEQLMWDWKDKILTHFGVVAFQLPMWEVSGGPDSGVFGGQIQTGFKAGSRVKLGANLAFYNYRNADRIAQNLNGGAGFSTNGTATGFGGTYGFGGSGISNNFGTIGAVNGTRYYASQFGIADVLLRADIDTGHAKWPVALIADYVQNTRACSNLQVFYDAQVINPAQVIPACDKHQRYGHWLEAQFGQTKNPHDMRIGYTFMRIDRDAVVSAFNFSDIRQATNDANHRLEFYYQAYKNITVGVTGLFGRQLVNAQSPTPERYVKRFQFDVVYAF
jgi:hypothetical protein